MSLDKNHKCKEHSCHQVKLHAIWVWPVIVSLSVTAWVLGWITVTHIVASKDVQITKIQMTR